MTAWDDIVALLRAVTVQVRGADLGTGFFVAPNLIVTCAHVVGVHARKSTEVQIRPGGEGSPLAARVVEILPDRHEDVAVLELVKGPSAGAPVICDVFPVLDDSEASHGDELLVFGFPKYTLAESQRIDSLYAIYATLTGFTDDPDHQFHKFKGDRVVGGLSGSPILNLNTGHIIGVVDETLDPRGEAGGWSIPARFILESLPDVSIANRHHARREPWAHRISGWRAARMPQVPLLERTFEEDSVGLHRFLYRTRKVPFFGREDEMKVLGEFLADSPKFSWMIVTGPGGSGKSRLALELCLQASPIWRGGFLQRDRDFDFSTWLPNRPTLIVVDYVASRAQSVGKIIRILSSNADRFPFPVRVLLLERTSEGSWITEFIGTGSEAQAIQAVRYRASFHVRRRAQTTPDDMIGKRFDQVPSLEGLELGGLSDEDLWGAIAFIVNGAAGWKGVQEPNKGPKSKLLEQFRELDPSGRPLFAALFADAVSANSDSRQWDVAALAQDVLAREEREYWMPAGITEEDKSLLALATLTRGLDLRRDDLPPQVDYMLKSFSEERYRLMSGRSAETYLAPLEPDMLGEIFVLNFLKPKSVRDKRASETRQIAWAVDGVGVAEFLTLVAQDFPEHQTVWKLAECPTDAPLYERTLWMIASYYVLPACAKAGLDQAQLSLWKRQLWQCYRDICSSAADRHSKFFIVGAATLGPTLFASGDAVESIEFYDHFIANFGSAASAPVREQVAMALLSKGITLSQLERPAEEIAVYDEVVARFGDAPEPALRAQVAMALVNKGITVGRSAEGIAVFDDVVARFGDASEPALREPVARALVSKGITLGRLGRSAEAVGVYDEVVARFGDASEPALGEQVAMALVNKGVRLGRLGRSAEEVAVYDDVVARFGDASEPGLREAVARALVSKGVTLVELGRSAEAIAVYDEVLARFDNASEPAPRERVARALVNKGTTLSQLGRSAEAIAVYDEIVARFGEAAEPALREQVAKALVNNGITLGRLGRSAEEIAVYDEVVARFGDASEPGLRDPVAKALASKGITLAELGRAAEAVAVYDEVVARFGDASEPTLREQVAGTLLNKGITLGQFDRLAEAVAVWDEIVARFGGASEPALREQVARAFINKGVTLGRMDRSAEEVAVYDDMVARFGDASEPALREQVAMALFNKGMTVGQLGRSAEAIAVCDDMVARFGGASEPALREQVAMALVSKGITLHQLERSVEAIAVYDEVMARFGDTSEPTVRELVTMVEHLRGELDGS